MRKFGTSLAPAALFAFILAGCHSSQNSAQMQPVSSGDPAAANLALASDSTTGNPPAPPADQAANAAPPPASDPYAQPGSDQDEQDDSAEDVAAEAPPPLPDYDQPPCPGDDYMWTPGYWAYASDGYYWVPGEWVLAPWVGALWTPGYWGFDNSRYAWHDGYWGPHIGFYGGVNYGYGYYGDGYEGGYWRNNAFYYNTAITHVNRSDIHNVYDYHVTPRNNSHVSYNGGHGGLSYRATASQQAAQRERHVAPLASQRSSADNARQNTAQFERNNHGHPQTVAETRPMNDGRTAPAARVEDFHQAAAPRTDNNRAGANTHQPGRTSPMSREPERAVGNNRPSPRVTRPTREPSPSFHPQSRPQSRPQAQPGTQPGASERRNEPRTTPQRTTRPAHPQAAPNETRRPETRGPEQRPAAPPHQETRPAHQETRPAHQETRPAPRQPEKPQEKPNDNHPH
ncbi:MAG TPA: hypothetical protein VHX37_15780 [Acidobacteriaceae bacterium]|jgi:hypothetical protein|nr:hypothetical protein [Acidobacteriaceae bacterium]